MRSLEDMRRDAERFVAGGWSDSHKRPYQDVLDLLTIAEAAEGLADCSKRLLEYLNGPREEGEYDLVVQSCFIDELRELTAAYDTANQA